MDTTISSTNSSVLHQAHQHDNQPFHPQSSLPGFSLLPRVRSAEAGFTRSMNDTNSYNSRSRPHCDQQGNQLYQPQQPLPGPTTQREPKRGEHATLCPTRARKIIPREAVCSRTQITSASHTSSSSSSRYQNQRETNQLYQ
jgi:hypothetical protein